MVHSLEGKSAPSFSAPDASGETYNFTPGTDGVHTILFFYPKSGSYGCTKEVCSFQEATEKETFKRLNVKVVGVSPDSVEKQKVFIAKHKVTFPIISDESGEARKAYSVGKHVFGPSTRTTFIIDKHGVVRHVYDAMMSFGAHVKVVNKELDKLEAEDKSAAEAVTVVGSAAETAVAPGA